MSPKCFDYTSPATLLTFFVANSTPSMSPSNNISNKSKQFNKE